MKAKPFLATGQNKFFGDGTRAGHSFAVRFATRAEAKRYVSRPNVAGGKVEKL